MEKRTLSIEEIMDIIPHRPPFLLVDKILDFEPGKWAIGQKCVTMNEDFFKGHFPGRPMMPGVLMIESLAQVGAIALLSVESNKDKLAVFGGIKNARFREQIRPGDVLELKCELTAQKGPIGMGKAEATVNGKKAVSCELTFALVEKE